MLAYNYPLLDAFWTMLWFVGFIIWVWLAIRVFSDIFRSHDMSGWAKALWVIGIIIFPVLGVLVYLIARGEKMQARAQADAQVAEQATRDYIRSVAGGGSRSTADELAKLAHLRDTGGISSDEFEREKAKLLASSS